MRNPYVGKPPFQFWRQGVADIDPRDVDPVVAAAFPIRADDRICTAGSCFAQHIAKTLVAEGYNYLVTEPGPTERTYGVFPARFGNVYTIRQMLQLFKRAYGLEVPADDAWMWRGGRVVDPFRPRSEPEGFGSRASLQADRVVHLAAVRRMFEDADVFIFPLGLTEAWRCETDGAIVPLAPGVHGTSEAHDYAFVNFGFDDLYRDMVEWITLLRTVNPSVRLLLTVSPVPLVATFENRHVLVSTVASKSALRTVADEVVRKFEGTGYFPSFEIITGPHNRARYFADDLRDVTAEGVAAVMGLFKTHYLGAPTDAAVRTGQPRTGALRTEALDQLSAILCEERALDVGHVA